jgi:hypothetical protein
MAEDEVDQIVRVVESYLMYAPAIRRRLALVAPPSRRWPQADQLPPPARYSRKPRQRDKISAQVSATLMFWLCSRLFFRPRTTARLDSH